MRLGLLQTNPLIGDVRGNLEKIKRLVRLHASRSDLFLTSEQALIGYPARDLLSQTRLLDEEARALESLRALSAELGVGILVGHCERRVGAGRPLFNSASLFDSGTLKGVARKRRLPAYDIFEEERFFEPWTGAPELLEFRGKNLFVSICEDGWDSVRAFGVRDVRNYPKAPESVAALSRMADVLVNISASPFVVRKQAYREDLFRAQAARFRKPLVYVNAVGGQDDVLFEGGSFVLSPTGEVVARAKSFEEDQLFFDATESEALPEIAEEIDWSYVERGLCLGIRDFVRKSGARQIVLGLSGGVDSALVAALAARALGPENVLGVSLPSELTSDLSKSEARRTAETLGISFREIPVAATIESVRSSLGLEPRGLAFENLQSRTRGITLAAISNHEGRLVLATGNKSELAMGYATLYGDMIGALAPIGDLYKTEVYALCRDMNARAKRDGVAAPIPEATLSRPPTAELAPGQKDTDSLPDYPVLDAVLMDLIENQGRTIVDESEWDRKLAPQHTVADIRRRYLAQEFKRRQAPPILKVHARSFGYGWHVPVAKGVLP